MKRIVIQNCDAHPGRSETIIEPTNRMRIVVIKDDGSEKEIHRGNSFDPGIIANHEKLTGIKTVLKPIPSAATAKSPEKLSKKEKKAKDKAKGNADDEWPKDDKEVDDKPAYDESEDSAEVFHPGDI